MKIKYHIIPILIIFLFSGFIIQENKWEEISISDMTNNIKKIEDFYKNTSSYSLKITHKTFKSHTETKVEDFSNGFFIKDAKNNYHSYSLGIHTIQNAKYKLTIDSTNKSILVSDPDKAFTKEVKVSELKDFLKICTAIKKYNGEKNDYYKFEFGKTGTYKAYEIIVNENWQITKIKIYFNTEVLSDPSNEKSAKTKPRGEILFTDYKTGIIPDYKKYFDESQYITVKNNEFNPTEKFKGFTVYDLRVKD